MIFILFCILVSIPVPAKKMRNYGPVNNFIASSLANIRESNAEKTRTTEQTRKRSSYFDELEAKPLPLKTLPANHLFVSQAERLRLENIITSMKQVRFTPLLNYTLHGNPVYPLLTVVFPVCFLLLKIGHVKKSYIMHHFGIS